MRKGFYENLKLVSIIRGLSLLVITTLIIANTSWLIAAPKKSKPRTEKEMKLKVRELLSEGRQLYLDGKSDKAIEKFHQVNDIKPNHLGARIAIQTIMDEKLRIAGLERDNVVEQRLLDTERLIHHKRKSVIEKIVRKYELGKMERQKTAKRIELEHKLNTRIPEINFTNAHLKDVIQYLHNVGDVNIIIDEGVFQVLEETPAEIPSAINVGENEGENDNEIGDNTLQTLENETAVIEEEKGGVSNTASSADRVTISLRDIPLIEAIKYILRTKKLKYRIDDYAVWISKDVSAPEMITRSYKLLGGKCSINKLTFDKPSTDEPAPGAKVEEIMNIKDVIQEIVPFPPDSKIYLEDRSNTLVVTNTKENHDLIAELVEKLSIPPAQVEIEAKFVEISQEQAEELGLEIFSADPNGIGKAGVTSSPPVNTGVKIDSDVTDPVFGRQFADIAGAGGTRGFTSGLRFLSETISGTTAPSGNILALGGILGEPQFKMVLHALNQLQNVDVMNSPKITTLNGHQAEIKLVTEFWYPQEFEVIPAVNSGTLFNPDGTPKQLAPPAVEAGDFIKRDVGVILNVTPDVGSNYKTINLTIIPEVSKFENWINYGTADAPQIVPIFSSDNVATSVVVNDGNTIVLGGSVRINRVKQHDKIPFIGDIPYVGRAFRSETEVDHKVNLLIFVTVHIVAPTGEPYKDEIKNISSDIIKE